MCRTVVWAVNRAAWTPAFLEATHSRLGAAPRPSELRLVSDAVRSTAAHFTLEVNGCDCGALVGLGADRLGRGEIEPAAWLGWFRDLPTVVPHLTSLAFMPVWLPTSDAVTSAGAVVEVTPDDVTEAFLSGVQTDELVVVSWPPRSEQNF